MTSHTLTSQRLLLLTLAIAVAVIGSALGSQYIGGLEPCKLCHWQRIPYYVGIPLILLALLSANGPQALRKLMIACVCLIFVAGIGLGMYHVGVEQGWWPGPVSCSSSATLAGDLDQQIEALFNKQRVDCRDPAWVLFGISMAGYNAIMSLVMAGLALVALVQSKAQVTNPGFSSFRPLP
jgi:disulfide bond formation protein DsbB